MKGLIGWLTRDSWLRVIIILMVLAPTGLIWASHGTVRPEYIVTVPLHLIVNFEFREYVREINFYAPWIANPPPDAGKRCIDDDECITRWCRPDDWNVTPILGTCQRFPSRGSRVGMSHGRTDYCDADECR